MDARNKWPILARANRLPYLKLRLLARPPGAGPPWTSARALSVRKSLVGPEVLVSSCAIVVLYFIIGHGLYPCHIWFFWLFIFVWFASV